MSNKTSSHLLDYKTQARNFLRPANNYKQAAFKSVFKASEFKITNNMLTHMNDLRVWVIAYAPSSANVLERMQEIHHINNEMNYRIYRRAWKALVVLPFVWILVNKVYKKKFLDYGNQDTAEMSWRNVQALHN